MSPSTKVSHPKVANSKAGTEFTKPHPYAVRFQEKYFSASSLYRRRHRGDIDGEVLRIEEVFFRFRIVNRVILQRAAARSSSIVTSFLSGSAIVSPTWIS
jgi:hypothetical protein